MFEHFDFAVLDDPSFKEDAVREEIIAPILRRLGYAPSGSQRVMRSKTLRHPFVMIGSTRRSVNIIPDYTLYEGEVPLLVLDAKAPTEVLVGSHHTEQAYSYAIHPDVRVRHYALCNGRELVVFLLDQWDPLIRIPIPEVDRRWDEVVEVLSPRFLADPDLRGFAPDYGMAVKKAGLESSTLQVFVGFYLQDLNRVEDSLYSGCASADLGSESDYLISFDFDLGVYEALLAKLPQDFVSSLRSTLSRQPFRADLDGKVVLSCSGYLGQVTEGAYEEFVPIRVTEIEAAHFDPTVDLHPWARGRV